MSDRGNLIAVCTAGTRVLECCSNTQEVIDKSMEVIDKSMEVIDKSIIISTIMEYEYSSLLFQLPEKFHLTVAALTFYVFKRYSTHHCSHSSRHLPQQILSRHLPQQILKKC